MTEPTLDYHGREPTAQRNSLASWSLGFGINGLLLAPCVVGAGLGIVAIVLGYRAVKDGPRSGRAYAGISLGLLAVIVAGSMLVIQNRLVSRTAVARRATTIAQLKTISAALEAFRTDNGRYPSDAENLDALVVNLGGDVGGTWRGPYVTSMRPDIWGYPIFYRLPGKANPARFDLLSAGEDHVYETADDIYESSKP